MKWRTQKARPRVFLYFYWMPFTPKSQTCFWGGVWVFSFPSAENDTFACAGSTAICIWIFFPVWLQRVCDQFSSPGRLDPGADHDLGVGLGVGLQTKQGRSLTVRWWVFVGRCLYFSVLWVTRHPARSGSPGKKRGCLRPIALLLRLCPAETGHDECLSFWKPGKSDKAG